MGSGPGTPGRRQRERWRRLPGPRAERGGRACRGNRWCRPAIPKGPQREGSGLPPASGCPEREEPEPGEGRATCHRRAPRRAGGRAGKARMTGVWSNVFSVGSNLSDRKLPDTADRQQSSGNSCKRRKGRPPGDGLAGRAPSGTWSRKASSREPREKAAAGPGAEPSCAGGGTCPERNKAADHRPGLRSGLSEP